MKDKGTSFIGWLHKVFDVAMEMRDLSKKGGQHMLGPPSSLIGAESCYSLLFHGRAAHGPFTAQQRKHVQIDQYPF